MALFVVATPIGNGGDFTVRSLEVLKAADLVIGEELKALRPLLKAAGVQAPRLDQLNEHSTAQDIEQLLQECQRLNVALVSDCGTPGFCDPGAELVRACRKAGVPVHAVPGPSSLMALLSIAGVRVDTFVFAGFLPSKTTDRQRALKALASEKRAVILLETPYRLRRLLDDMGEHFPRRRCTIGLNLTANDERVCEGSGHELAKLVKDSEAEPVLLIHPV